VDNNEEPQSQSLKTGNTVDQAFRNLAITHNLGKSSDVLSLAAIRSYAAHNLQAALTYCTVIDTLDPFCRTAGYVYVATLVGLGLKRRLFQLAHRLVDADPKDALAWFAVGSYYHLCKRHELSQRHFSRSTRLDPSSAECWIGFGCSFAVCDESDQALASFRAAQNKYSGSHVPLLYMGMEYIRTNHLSLAGHFLASSQRTDPSDPLCCNELGVWSFRRGELEDAAFWFVKALRLRVEAESSALTSTDEALGTTGYILLNRKASDENTGTGNGKATTETPSAKTEMSVDQPPISSILCAIKTPSGQSIASHKSSNFFDAVLTDLECVDRCKDAFWEPTIYNLGQSYRKLKQYSDAIVCFQKCASLNPVSSLDVFLLLSSTLLSFLFLSIFSPSQTLARGVLLLTPVLDLPVILAGTLMEPSNPTTTHLAVSQMTRLALKC
jgi:tetratricopeptide (TPR) repeat protein